MSTHVRPTSTVRSSTLRSTDAIGHLLVARVIAGVPLLGIGLAHVFVPEAPMLPLVEAAGFPFPAIVAPIAVVAEIIAGVSLLVGVYARLGGVIAVPTMLGAVWAHLVIDVWPNGPDREPPLALPILVLIAAVYVASRGAGRFSLDHRATRTAP